jgi:hypothetical protein
MLAVVLDWRLRWSRLGPRSILLVRLGPLHLLRRGRRGCSLCAVWASVSRAIELRYPSATCPLGRLLYMTYLRGVHLHRRRIACVSRLNHDLRLRSSLRLLRQI